MATKKPTVKKAVTKKTTPSKAKATSKAVASKKVAAATTKKAVAQPKKTATAKKAVKESTKKPVSPTKKTVGSKPVASKAKTTKPVVSKNTAKVTATAKTKAVATAAAKKAPVKKATPSKTVAAKVAKPVTKATKVAKPVATAKVATKVDKKVVEKVAKTAVSTKPVTTKAVAAPVETKATTQGRKKKEPAVAEQVVARRETEGKKNGHAKEEHNLTMKTFGLETRSILAGADENTGPVYRYSDEDLNEFRELILKRLENARKELVYLQGLITRKDEAGTEDTDNRFNHMEDGSGAMEREQLSQLAGRQIQFISHLENALVRVENKTYGICRVTGKLISKARLRAVPHATLSIEAKNGMRK